jgi:hypothetical protein
MKKITFILLALIAGTAFAQNTATGQATVGAEIIKPITITKDADLNFGRLIGDANGGVVNVAALDNARTSGNADLLDPSSSIATAAQFTINAANNTSYSINIPSTIQISGGGSTNMDIVLNPLLDGTALSAGNESANGSNQTLKVGGDLTLGTNQTEGSYTGTFDVTVTYE